MKKILLCTGEEKLFDEDLIMFKSNIKDIEIKHIHMFKNDTIINKIFRNLGGLFIKESLNPILKLKKNDYDVMIFFECIVKNSAIKFIRKNNPNTRIIIYFRNPFSYSKRRNVSLRYLEKLNCEFWSYNRNDCQKIGFKYNSQFWNTNYLKEINRNSKNIYDFCFLGRVKNREKELVKLEEFSQKNNRENYFYLVPKTKFSFDKNIFNKYMSYVDYLNIIDKSKCVVDFVSKKNYGLTLRPLEAQFLKKKLITNYKEIKYYDFYCKENIFILGEDKFDTLKNFINDSYIEINQKIQKYDFDSWILNFFK